MQGKQINLTQAEWSIMEYLWDNPAVSGRQIVEEMQQVSDWSRSTTLTLLTRLEGKGAVSADSRDGKKHYTALLGREDAALQETEAFLSRVYRGSVSLMLSALTKKQALSKAEIEELSAMLKQLEEGDEHA